MSLISRLNSKFGRFAVPNVTILLIVGQVFLYVAQYFNPNPNAVDVLEQVRLYPAEVMSGQVWRLFTFLFDPPVSNPFFAFFFWYLFYLMGTTLEVSWGWFRYNLFLLLGYVASVAMSFIVYYAAGRQNLPASNAFLYGTVFLAFARLYPNFVLQMFLILPVKIRWLAMLQWIGYGLTFLLGDWMSKGMVAASVFNYFMFFGFDIWRDTKYGHRRMQYQAKVMRSPRLVHKCAVCGLTSDDAPRLQFRYCSKCDDDSCYCPDHLQNHEHVVKPQLREAGEKVR